MPEGPECHNAAAKLEHLLAGKRLLRVTVHGGRYAKHGNPQGFDMLNQACRDGDIRLEYAGAMGKLIVLFLSNDICILSTLGLSGTWTQSRVKHCDLSMTFDGVKTVWFKDQLHYGTFKVVPRLEAIKKIRSLGPDVTVSDPRATLEWWVSLCKKYSKWNICKLLMDQAKVSGIGNYLKAEILYEAGVRPTSTVGEIPYEGLEAIHRQMLIVPAWHFQAKLGTKHRRFLKVYNRKKDPLGNKVTKGKTGDGRTSHWVESLQPEYV